MAFLLSDVSAQAYACPPGRCAAEVAVHTTALPHARSLLSASEVPGPDGVPPFGAYAGELGPVNLYRLAPPARAPGVGPQAPPQALALRAVHDARGGGGHGHRRARLRVQRVLRRGGPPREAATRRRDAARPSGSGEHGVRRDVSRPLRRASGFLERGSASTGRPTSDRYRHSVEISALRRPRSGRVKFEGEALVTGAPPPLALVAPVPGRDRGARATRSALRRDGVNVTAEVRGTARLGTGWRSGGAATCSTEGWSGSTRRMGSSPGTPAGTGRWVAAGSRTARRSASTWWRASTRWPRAARARTCSSWATSSSRWARPSSASTPRIRSISGGSRPTTERCSSPSARCMRTATSATWACCAAASCSPLASSAGRLRFRGRDLTLDELPGVTEDQDMLW